MLFSLECVFYTDRKIRGSADYVLCCWSRTT